jgi:putative spermidine/putrescine transport system permease protein
MNRREGGAWLLIAPAVTLLAIFYIVPLAQVLWISVVEPRPGLGNYALLVESAAVKRVLWTTFRIGLITTLISVTLAYVVAYAIVHATPRHRQIALLFVLLPFWISVLVRAFAWVALLRSNGLLNALLRSLGLIDQPLEMIYNEIGVVIGMVHYMAPMAALTLYANMQGIDRRLVAAARGMGASRRTAFFRVFLPLSLPGIVAAGVLVFIFSLGFYITPAILGGGKTLMIAEYISVMITETLNWGAGTMMASTLMIAVLILLAILSRFVDLRRLFGAA